VKESREFAADPASVPAARKFVVAVLKPSSAEVLEAAELMVSELATNAVRHVHSDFDVSIERSGHQIRIEVTDRGDGVPMMRCPPPTEPSGRGLRIIDMFAETWGVDRHLAGGKTVWFTISMVRSDAGDQLLGRAGDRHPAR
jgi:anti-sigma regulatory factor (Ser/Thr protein kinase)